MRILLLLLYVICHTSLRAQDQFNGIDETVEPGNFADDFPLELNRATRKQLELCKCLNESQVEGILYHIEAYGGFISRYELMAVPGMDDPEKLLEYFFIHELPVTDAPPAPAETPVQGAWVVQTRWRNALGFQYRGRLDYT